MSGLLDPNSTLLMELNLWVLLCCLPVVTVGAALCSMHAVLLKIYRDEEKRVTADFFRAMVSNLKNGILLWLLYLGYLALLIGLLVLVTHLVPGGPVYLMLGLLLAAIIGFLYLDWALILQSRYVYTVPQCLKYALLAWAKYPGSTFVYLVSIVLPIVFCYSLQILPLMLLLGITLL